MNHRASVSILQNCGAHWNPGETLCGAQVKAEVGISISGALLLSEILTVLPAQSQALGGVVMSHPLALQLLMEVSLDFVI